MQVWEYRQVDLNDLPRKTHEVDVLNELGDQGWELVGILGNHVAYLKRRAVAVSRSSSPAPPKTPPSSPPRSPRAS
jgi:hypothetical protein